MASAALPRKCHLAVTDNEKRWLVFGIALNKILIPHVRPLVEQEVNKEYNTLKTSHSIDSQSATSRLEKWHKWLKYENINGNDVLPRLPGGKYDYCNFKFQVLTHTDFSKLYLESCMVHFNAFDDCLDASAVLLLLGRVPVFPGTVQAAANSVRNERNDWAHCVFSKWNEAKLQDSFAEMEDLVKAMALPSSVEEKIVGELEDWKNKGTQLCINSPVDQTLLQLVHQNVHSLENEVKNWSEGVKEEKEKVQQQLQIFDLAFKEINPRLRRLETGQLRLKRDHERLKTKQRRLESHSRDVEQRVIQCEVEISGLKQKRPYQESHKSVAHPERCDKCMRRNYENTMCPFPSCEDRLQIPEYVRPVRRRANNGESNRSLGTNVISSQISAPEHPLEMEESIRENVEVENFIQNLGEESVRRLATTVLSRGIGSLKFVQSQLVAAENDCNGPSVNAHGSPIRLLSAREMPGPSYVAEQFLSVAQETLPDRLPTIDRPRQPTLRVPDWCKCGHCRQMPSEIENVCCTKKDCITLTLRFDKLCLYPNILELRKSDRSNITYDRFDKSTQKLRKAAYRRFILNEYGRLGRGNRKVIPSCVVWKVRSWYPSTTGVYMGFRVNNIHTKISAF
ncbi:uncharacterized protein LOC141859558 isoform X2 [Acropora palmata]|uniref:uncharacterized protein LOC141859558 isoform X2 n=1 Tax=Acropora palmata TaxID=6131 RepID=UPI003DA06277